MKWRNKFYRAEADLLGVVHGLMGCHPANYETISNDEIGRYIRTARRFRDAFMEEKGQHDGHRPDSESAGAVRARLQLSQRDEQTFYPGQQCDYLTPERILLLACVAVTGSREGARFLAGIALNRRTLKGLQTHINL